MPDAAVSTVKDHAAALGLGAGVAGFAVRLPYDPMLIGTLAIQL